MEKNRCINSTLFSVFTHYLTRTFTFTFVKTLTDLIQCYKKYKTKKVNPFHIKSSYICVSVGSSSNSSCFA